MNLFDAAMLGGGGGGSGNIYTWDISDLVVKVFMGEITPSVNADGMYYIRQETTAGEFGFRDFIDKTMEADAIKMVAQISSNNMVTRISWIVGGITVIKDDDANDAGLFGFNITNDPTNSSSQNLILRVAGNFTVGNLYMIDIMLPTIVIEMLNG